MGEHVQQLLEILDCFDRDCGRWSVGDRNGAFVGLAGDREGREPRSEAFTIFHLTFLICHLAPFGSSEFV